MTETNAPAVASLVDNWDSRPTPSEAADLLRQYARKRNLPPGDNNFDDAASVIDRLTAALAERTEACAKAVEAAGLVTLRVTDDTNPMSIFKTGARAQQRVDAAAIRKLHEQKQ